MRVQLYAKWSYVGVKISTLAEVLVPWRALTELSATLAELYALLKWGVLDQRHRAKPDNISYQ